MQETIQDLTSAHWWITVAIASLILNVLASYLRGGLDRILPRISKRLKAWTERKAAELTADVDRTSGDVQLMTFLAARQASLHIAALHNYVLGAALFYASGKVASHTYFSILLWLIGLLFTLAGSRDFGRAIRCRTILDGIKRKPKTA